MTKMVPLKIYKVVQGSPADRLGVKPWWIVKKLNGKRYSDAEIVQRTPIRDYMRLLLSQKPYTIEFLKSEEPMREIDYYGRKWDRTSIDEPLCEPTCDVVQLTNADLIRLANACEAKESWIRFEPRTNRWYYFQLFGFWHHISIKYGQASLCHPKGRTCLVFQKVVHTHTKKSLT